MLMGRGARIIRTGGRIVVSIRSNNARRRGRETADFATATPSQGMAQNREGDIGVTARKTKAPLPPEPFTR
jgi:hypothetical protein